MSAPDWTEAPITASRQDRLSRIKLAERLADALIVRDTGQATGAVLGLTGPWGSGKSSFLNLMAEWVADNHPRVVLVRFNPWLIGARDALVGAFLADVGEALAEAGTPRGKRGARAGMGDLVQTLLDYGKRIAPAGNLLLPGAGAAAAGGMDATSKALGERGTLHDLRARLAARLDETRTHVLVLIDEIDRISDAEIALVAQLVRAVADFPHFSYVLAYDAERVAEALGGGNVVRGRAYLEKIVQLQVPLPPISDAVLRGVIAGRAKALCPEADERRLTRLLDILVPGSIGTLRDAKRMLGVYEVLEPMHRWEVDPVDLLGWAAILTKHPSLERVLNANRLDLLGKDGVFFGEDLLDRMRKPGQAWSIVRAFAPAESPSELLECLAEDSGPTAIFRVLPLAKVLSGGALIDARTGAMPHPRHVDVVRAVGDKSAAALRLALEDAEKRSTLAEFLAALYGASWRALPKPAASAWTAFSDYCERAPAIAETSRETPNRLVAKFLAGPWLASLGMFEGFLGDPTRVVRGWIDAGRFSLAGHLILLRAGFLDGSEIERLGAAVRRALADGTLLDRLPDMACLRAILGDAASGWNEDAYRMLRESLSDLAQLDRLVWLCHAEGVPDDSAASLFVDRVAALVELLKARMPAISDPLLGAAYARAFERAELHARLR